MRLDWAFRSRKRSAGIFAALFVPALLDGKTLNGWDGDPAYWRVEDGAMVGETKPGAIPRQNTFLIWRGGSPSDCELVAEYRISGGNSGIQYPLGHERLSG
jgi:hypothetical protein